eukprot:JP448087.1.p3 GENE.JP448087.1~~JP448087.1.p3  ORF type:complete len:60 (+),score=19.74 JP448087.1:19-198(+)
MPFSILRQCYIDNPELGEFNLRAKAMANFKTDAPSMVKIGGEGQLAVYNSDGKREHPSC